MGYLFTDLGAEVCCRSLNALFILRFCPCPMLWCRQQQAISSIDSPFISVLRINTSQATITDINLHTFKPRLSRPPLLSSTGKWESLWQIWYRTWYAVHVHTIWVTDCPHALLPWIIAERKQDTYSLLLILGDRCLVVRTGVPWTFPPATQHLAEMAPEHNMSSKWQTVASTSSRVPSTSAILLTDR